MNVLVRMRPGNGIGWDSLCGVGMWEKIFKACLAERKDVSELPFAAPAFFILWGETGMGKRTVSDAFANDAQKEGFSVYSVYAQDLQDELAETAPENWLLDFQEEKKVFLRILRLDQLGKKRKGAKLLRRFLESLRQMPSNPVVIATAASCRKIPEYILELFQVCPLIRPDTDEIVRFLELKLGSEAGSGYAEFAKEAEGYSYGQLSELVRNALRYGRNPASDGNRDENQPAPTPDTLRLLKKTVYHPDPGEKAGRWQAGNVIQPRESVPSADQSAAAAVNAAAANAAGSQLEQLETDNEDMQDSLEKAGSMLGEVEKSLNRSIDDITDDELRAEGYDPGIKIPEDEEQLMNATEEERAAFCELLSEF